MSSNLPIIRVKRLHSDATLPSYGHMGVIGGDSGADLVAVENTEWKPVLGQADTIVGYKAIVKTGFSIELPPGYEFQIRPRSGNAAKFNMSVLNTPGTIDNGYRGEIMVILFCLGLPMADYRDGVPKGAKVGQGVIAKFEQAEFVEVDDLSVTERGDGKFNSSGTYLSGNGC